MKDDKPAAKKRRGWSVEREMPDRIPDSPENIARAIMQRPSRTDWDYLEH